MAAVLFIAAAVTAYLISGVNPAIIMSRLIYHQDIRQQGSGNPGFTNFKRVYGNRYAWFVFFLDLLKSAAPVFIFRLLFDGLLGMGQFGAAYTGIFAMLGHIFPIWYRFRGGKGFLVGVAAIFCVDWRVGLVGACVMLILLALTKYMSLSVIAAAVSCPISLYLFGDTFSLTWIFVTLGCALMIWRHKANIIRLLEGTESKFSLRSKSKKADAEKTEKTASERT